MKKKYVRRNVQQISSIDGSLINTFTSTWEASRNTGIAQSNICNVCNGKRGYAAGGFIWRFENDKKKINLDLINKNKKAKPVHKIDSETGMILSSYVSIASAKKDTNVEDSNISRVCILRYGFAGGYFWRYVNDHKWDYETCKKRTYAKYKPVIRIDIETGEITGEYKSISEAADRNKNDPSGISKCCRSDLHKISAGYLWAFK